MASSSSSPSNADFSSQVWEYHVFLSFRGEDTRKAFVDHLYTALEQKGIYTYKDDETLPRGESIGPSLINAIGKSQIAIIVFSKNYANSTWCLDELEYIMKCKDTRGQIVMPVFYDVDPSEVRKQKRKYGEAFVRHELENNNKVESWRKALVDASEISGWEIKYIDNGNESKCIKELVDTISRMVHPLTFGVDDNLVGVEARMKDLISKLQIEFGGTRMIGILGVGGGGKTTLASSVYDEISIKFDGCCFLKNIREESSNNNGLERLQEKIICGVLQQNQVHVGRVEEGRRMIKDRLRHKKVLIVLDDVDKLEHLKELAGSHDWFGDESRVIITTRDENVLTAHKVDAIYNITLLNNDEAMKLFSKYAHRGHRQIEDYEQVLKDVVSYVGGLPLALKVLGCFLCDKEINEWRSALARLKEIPDNDILDKLKISFDGLKPAERELFLDIACFFRGEEKGEQVMMILDACGFHPVIGIKVLVQKALITITKHGRFDMHDLVQEMAHYIVRGDNPKNPEKHSRIWKKEDVLKICAMAATTNLGKIEAIHFRAKTIDELQHALHVAANMKKLRWIDLEHSEPLDEITHPLIIMPKFFPPRELCCLTLDGLNAKQLWDGYKYLPNLRIIKLQELMSLIKTPDFEGLPNLERFMVEGSPLLEEIDPSFGRLKNLVSVVIKGCDDLEMLPPITRLIKLETFVLSECKSFNNVLKIQESRDNRLPHNMNHRGLWFISKGLRKMDLSFCNLTDGNIKSGADWELPNLKQLNLKGNRFVGLNFGLLRLPRLKCLDVSFCHKLVELSELPSSISVVIADDCRSLITLGDISNCKWLWKVSLLGTNKRGPLIGDTLLDSMLLGNAKDYFININLPGIDMQRWRSVLWVDGVTAYNLPLPRDWYNDFSGILMFVSSDYYDFKLNVKISIKQGLDQDFQSQLWQKSNEQPDTHSQDTCVGYVSFESLRHTKCLNSTFNVISFSLEDEDLYRVGCRFRAVLVPKDDLMQMTKVTMESSEFWDDQEIYRRKTFTIQHDPNSSVDILWRPLCDWHGIKLLKDIAKPISFSSLSHAVTSSVNNNHLIGIETRLQRLRSELQIGSGRVCMIGICGVGGGGKTTLASSIYDEISRKFDGCCFVGNIREESSRYSVGKLQEKLLCDVLKEKQEHVGRVDEGRHRIRDRLCNRKVLLVLDDVDHLDNLEALAGSHDWFGEGSRIIITTRDVHLLTVHRVDVIHNISLLNDYEAMQLFCKHVPRGHSHIADFQLLSKVVVSYAGGLPLALTILGSFLSDKDIHEWRSALARLKEIPETDIYEKLKISFDGLKQVEKELFLDIACFFRREDKDKAMEMLDACGFNTGIGVTVLIQKALITISNGMFDMHDLVQEMGHHIVRGEHPKNPENHSRLWKEEDVMKICAMDATKEHDMIKAIRFKCNGADPLQHPLIVANMKKLRWIDWEGDLASPLPTNFLPTELCYLKLAGSLQKQLWVGYKYLPSLRMMELYGLHNLVMTPNFDGLPYLERFKLTRCPDLGEIHPSIGHLERLVFLSIESCFGLKMFPPITGIKKLETLKFSRCPTLFKFTEIQQQNIHELQDRHSDKLFGENYIRDIGLHLHSLKKLDLSYCSLGDEHISSAFWNLPYLEKLDIRGSKFSKLDFSLLRLPRLKWLNISYCERLVELSELPSSIAVLVADGCTSLETFGDVSNCKCLWNVSHRRGKKLGPLGGDILLDSMLQGNAIDHQFLSVTLEHQNPEGFISRLFRRKAFTLHLPDDWYNDFCGFLICLVTDMKLPHISMIIEQKVDEDSRLELPEEDCNEAAEPEYDETTTSIGYVSFDSLLRQTVLSTTSFHIISLSIEDRFLGLNAAESYVGAELIPRKNKGDLAQATNDWDEEREHEKTFTIQHDSKSCIKMQWFPYNNSNC